MSAVPMLSYDLLISLVLLSLFLTLTLNRLSDDLLVVLVEGGKILTRLGELALLLALADIPVNEGKLGVHEVEPVVEARENLGDGQIVGHHAHSTLHLGEVDTRNNGGRLVVDAALEVGGAPVDELDGALGLDGVDSSVDILGYNVATGDVVPKDVNAAVQASMYWLWRGQKGSQQTLPIWQPSWPIMMERNGNLHYGRWRVLPKCRLPLPPF